MAKKFDMFFVAGILFAVIINTAYAANLGTLAEEEYASAGRGATVTFTVLFWTQDMEGFDVSMRIDEAPKGWTVTFEPQEFSLPAESPGRSVYLPQRGYIKAFAERISVHVPDKAPSGRYAVVVSAAAGDPSSGISVVQERTFRFDVDVTEGRGNGSPVAPQRKNTLGSDDGALETVANNTKIPSSENASSGNAAALQDAQGKTANGITGEMLLAGARGIIPALAIILIIYISWKIYRKP